MPPRKSARTAAAATAAATPLPLKGCLIVICGTFDKGVTLATITEKAKKLGADTHANVTKAVTHVISAPYYYNANGAKVRPALDKPKVKIVTYDWLLECEKENAHVKEDDYEFKNPPDPAANQAAPAAAAANGKKRAAPADEEDKEEDGDEEEEERLAPTKRAKRAATSKSDDVDDAKPASKGKGKAAATKAAPKAAAKKTAASKKAVKADDDEVDDDKPDVKPDEKPDTKVEPKTKTVKKTTVIPLDETCPLVSYKVYIDGDNIAYDASLNQTNASNNNNKFYRLQVLVNAAGDYKTWSRWGRVGERGQNATLGNGSLADAIKQFRKKFNDKAGLTWENRLGQGRPGKYTFIERSYDDSDDEDEGGEDGDDDAVKEEEDEEKYVPPESKLDPELQDLMALIFNLSFMQATMADLNYDANKMPLGKLSKTTITRGFQALKDLASLFDDKTLAQSKYNMTYGGAVEHLSNQFYSIIPHAFGRNRPPIISTEPMLKKEIDLLDSLGDMKEAAAIMKAERAGKRETEHEYDRQFKALNMAEMTPLKHGTPEFKNIEQYLLGTKGATHYLDFKVEDIFRIQRDGEFERFDNSEYASIPSDRRLLWHGSRCTNFGGILSQGLRIAPPEAPVSGYMFGKGIYLADMASKSANYCYSQLSDKTGLLLLCEAELGDPMFTLTDASYTAGEDAKKEGKYSTWGQGRVGPSKWKDAGCIHPSLKGVRMPDAKAAPPADTNVDGAYLMYNEYITYDIDQVRLRYLLRVRMT